MAMALQLTEHTNNQLTGHNRTGVTGRGVTSRAAFSQAVTKDRFASHAWDKAASVCIGSLQKAVKTPSRLVSRACKTACK